MKKILLGLLLFPMLAIAQQTITGHFAPENSFQFGILYRIAPDNVYYVTDANIDSEGTFKLNTQEDTTPGMYRIVYNLPQDQHFFDFIYNGKEAVEFTFNANKEITFTSSEENKLWSEYLTKSFQFTSALEELSTTEGVKERNISKALEEQNAWYQDLLKRAEGMLVYDLINAVKPYQENNFSTYKAYTEKVKSNYFNNFDFTKPLLQNSGLPLEHSIKYIFNYADPEHPVTSRNVNIDTVVKKIAATDNKYQKQVLSNLWDFLATNEQVSEANHLAEKHLIPLAQKLDDTALATKLTIYKNISIGSKAPNFSWPEYEGDKTLTKYFHDLAPAERYVIVFWSSLCSHCLNEVPKLHAKVASMTPDTVKVVAVGLEDFEAEWAPVAARFPLFTNVLGLKKWDNEIGNMYDVTATPTYFVLDADKKIIAKPEMLKDVFDALVIEK
ncbi:possible thiol-disulfide isomerase [unidentified eubacterium SCB49]|nr:possible thiol-disulfide isomerase [unidentified eubacterium SCB49]